MRRKLRGVGAAPGTPAPILPAVAALFVLASGGVHAAVVESKPDGFAVHEEFTTTGHAGAEIWSALLDIGRWWNKEHTYSGDAANLSIDARAGGCFCEKVGEGSVQHATVVNVIPKGLLRLSGGLGPLQQYPVGAVLSWTFKKTEGGGITVMADYLVGGYAPGGLADLAAPVDGVLGDQVQRLKRFLETGSPEPRP